jgi:hypothetical protein
MSAQTKTTCPSCGKPFLGPMEEHDPACHLRLAIEGIAKTARDFFFERQRDAFDMGYYILDDANNAVPFASRTAADTVAWGVWFELNRGRRIVKQEEIPPYRVSTLFLGLDHGMGRIFRHDPDPPHPLLFETMVFSNLGATPKTLNIQERCSTWQEAEVQHERIAAELRKANAG